MAAESFEMLAKADGTALGAGPVEVRLAPLASRGGASLASQLAAIGPGRKLYLILKGIRTNEQPETLYRVYLALPHNAVPGTESHHYAGSLNLFNARSEADSSRFYSYDVTDLVRTLQARKLLDAPLTVTIIPTAKPAATAKPVIGEIALVAQ